MSKEKHPKEQKTFLEPNLHIQITYNQGFVQSVTLLLAQKPGLHWSFSSSQMDQKLENSICIWLEAYRQRAPLEKLPPLNLKNLPLFTQKALESVAAIPFGEVSTYGEVAKEIGSPQGARGIGGSCRRNPFPIFIPCHRVLDAGHGMRGYSGGGISIKKALLMFEGWHANCIGETAKSKGFS